MIVIKITIHEKNGQVCMAVQGESVGTATVMEHAIGVVVAGMLKKFQEEALMAAGNGTIVDRSATRV